jgi:pyruvate/2-oxoglutarate dehydrogenase complex dihydrolipoamide acyltransferase (E2) component
VPSPASGTLKSLLVAIDDLVAEGQAIAIVAS